MPQTLARVELQSTDKISVFFDTMQPKNAKKPRTSNRGSIKNGFFIGGTDY